VNGYVAGGWAATAVMLSVYAWRVIHRGRKLSRTAAGPANLPWLRTGPPAPDAVSPESALGPAGEAGAGR
jgi:hypothetical protein